MPSTEYKTELIAKITAFLSSIGIENEERTLDTQTFLPGVHIENGKLLYDLEQLKYPGDLLHEAGHIALTPSENRDKIGVNMDNNGQAKQNSLEIGVICWSYAALKHLELDPIIVFHEEGYKGQSQWHIQNYESGNYTGLPLLQWMQLCKQFDDTSDMLPFPHMVKWLRD